MSFGEAFQNIYYKIREEIEETKNDKKQKNKAHFNDDGNNAVIGFNYQRADVC